jgi:hypothetical protein
MVYREPNLDTCASAAPARVVRSIGVFAPACRTRAGSLGVASIQTSYLRTDFRRRHLPEQRTRNATPLPPSQSLRRDRPTRPCDASSVFHQSLITRSTRFQHAKGRPFTFHFSPSSRVSIHSAWFPPIRERRGRKNSGLRNRAGKRLHRARARVVADNIGPVPAAHH